MKPKIFIDGEHGTTGLQIRVAACRPRRSRGHLDPGRAPQGRRPRAPNSCNAADVAILCLPDDAAKESVALIGNDTTRVIDASTAHRVADGWTYGFRRDGQGRRRRRSPARSCVANPGCWPQGPIATLRPLVTAGLLPADYPVTMNGISGYSGGGRQMIEDYEAKGEDAPRIPALRADLPAQARAGTASAMPACRAIR